MVHSNKYKNREDWLKDRQSKPILGSSDVATIMGLNPYKTPYKYWYDYKNQIEEPENDNLIRGQFKEDSIAKTFEYLTGEKIIKLSSEYVVYKNSKLKDYIQVSPDRELFASGRANRPGIECKDTKLFIPELNEKTCPQSWYCQIQYLMGVMERDSWYIVAEEGGKNIVYHLFPFNKEAFDHIYTYCCDWFEKYIIGDDIPPMETGQDVILTYPISSGTTKKVSVSIKEFANEIKALKSERKIIDSKIEELESKLKIEFADNSFLEYEGVSFASWKNIESSRIDTDLLKQKYPEIAKEVVKINTTRRLCLIK